MSVNNSLIMQQEALAKFILNCSRAAYDLKQLCEARRTSNHLGINHLGVPLEESASYVHKQICDEFNRLFGRPLFEDTQSKQQAPKESLPGNPYEQEDYENGGWKREERANNWMIGDR